MNAFKLEIMAPDEMRYQGMATSLTAKALDGELGILAHHAPLLTILGEGELKIAPEGKSEFKIEVSSGILKFENNLAQVFLDR